MSTPLHGEVLARTSAYIRENFLYMRPDLELANDDSLFEKGMVDSMGVVELLEFLQSEFEIVVADDEITEANLKSLSAIAAFVAAKKNGA